MPLSKNDLIQTRNYSREDLSLSIDFRVSYSGDPETPCVTINTPRHSAAFFALSPKGEGQNEIRKLLIEELRYIKTKIG